MKNAKRNTTGRKQAECKHCLLSIGNNNPESKVKSQKIQNRESWRTCTRFQPDFRTGIGMSPACSFLPCTGEYTGDFSIAVLQLRW